LSYYFLVSRSYYLTFYEFDDKAESHSATDCSALKTEHSCSIQSKRQQKPAENKSQSDCDEHEARDEARRLEYEVNATSNYVHVCTCIQMYLYLYARMYVCMYV